MMLKLPPKAAADHLSLDLALIPFHFDGAHAPQRDAVIIIIILRQTSRVSDAYNNSIW